MDQFTPDQVAAMLAAWMLYREPFAAPGAAGSPSSAAGAPALIPVPTIYPVPTVAATQAAAPVAAAAPPAIAGSHATLLSAATPAPGPAPAPAPVPTAVTINAGSPSGAMPSDVAKQPTVVNPARTSSSRPRPFPSHRLLSPHRLPLALRQCPCLICAAVCTCRAARDSPSNSTGAAVHEPCPVCSERTAEPAGCPVTCSPGISPRSTPAAAAAPGAAAVATSDGAIAAVIA